MQRVEAGRITGEDLPVYALRVRRLAPLMQFESRREALRDGGVILPGHSNPPRLSSERHLSA
jgi:hypothetical protein